MGLLDDAQLAAMIVRTRFAERGQTRRAIAEELRRKGLDGDVAEAALAQLDDADEAGAAVEVARARLRRTVSLDRPVRIRRALGALGRKGYSSGVAMHAIRIALAEESGRSEDSGRDDEADHAEEQALVEHPQAPDTREHGDGSETADGADVIEPSLRRWGSALGRRRDTSADDDWVESDVSDDGHTV